MSAMAEMMRMKKEKLVEQWSSHLETAVALATIEARARCEYQSIN